jgi:hypothetical protein
VLVETFLSFTYSRAALLKVETKEALSLIEDLSFSNLSAVSSNKLFKD